MASELWEIPPGISRQMGALGNYLWFMPVCGVCLCQREKHCKYFLSHSQAHVSFAEGPKRSQTHLPRYFLQVFFLQFCSQSRKAPMEEVLQWMAAGCEEERPRSFSLEEAVIQATPHAMLWVMYDRPSCRGPFHHATERLLFSEGPTSWASASHLSSEGGNSGPASLPVSRRGLIRRVLQAVIGQKAHNHLCCTDQHALLQVSCVFLKYL